MAKSIEWVGKVVSFLIIPIVVITMLEAALQYLFARTTICPWYMNLMLMIAFTILPGRKV